MSDETTDNTIYAHRIGSTFCHFNATLEMIRDQGAPFFKVRVRETDNGEERVYFAST